jgi:cysteine desulfurase
MSVSTARHYLDHNATSPLRPDARAAMLALMDHCGNASSIHAEGRKARAAIERARDAVAGLCGASTQDVIFTSGATEANNLALTPGLSTGKGQGGREHLLALATEHPCVLDGHRFGDAVSLIPVLSSGLIDLAALDALLAAHAKHRLTVAVQAANNETGVIQPIGDIALRVHAVGGLLQCDAVQVPGRLVTDAVTAGADMLTLSAHKIGGPQGAGALVLRAGGLHIEDRMIRGGGQEKGARAGTENVAAIAGLGAAARACLETADDTGPRLAALRDFAEAEMRGLAPDLVIFGDGAPRLPNTSAFALPGLAAETALMQFDLGGVALSSGSACSSGKVKRSHVLEAMGIAPELSSCALRLSLGWTSTRDDVIHFLAVFEKLVAANNRRRGARAA